MSTHIHEMHNDVSEVLFSEEQLKARVAELGAEIARDYADKDRVLLVSVLRGSYIFMADLSRAIDIPVEIDFMSVSSYGKGTKSSGQVEIKKDLSDSIEGVHVIVVEDILDSGNTLYFLKNYLTTKGAASITIVTLLDKPARREKPITADLAGFEVPDEFVVGYGLDYAQQYRNYPCIGVLKPEVYSK